MEYKPVILGFALLALVFVVFALGVFVGKEKANFSFRWADAYHRNFEGVFLNANGACGQVLKVSGTQDNGTITIKDLEGTERTVLVTKQTTVRSADRTVPLTSLKAGTFIVIFGVPTADGQISAQLIRIMPKNIQSMFLQLLKNNLLRYN